MPSRPATSPRAAACSPRWPRSTGSDPACSSTASCPTSSTTARAGGALDRRSSPLPPGPVAPRPAGPRRRPAGRPRDQLRPDVHDRPPEPDRDPAARLRRRLRRASSNRAEALVRGGRVPARRQRRDGRGHGRRDRRPGAAGRPRRRVRAHRAPRASERITVEDLARLRTTNRWEVVSQMARATTPGVPCRRPDRSGLRTLTERRG